MVSAQFAGAEHSRPATRRRERPRFLHTRVVRDVLEQLEAGVAGEGLLVALAYLAAPSVPVDADELHGARRRALLLLATGGDPRRDLDPDGRAVRALADDLDAEARRAALARVLERLSADAEGLPAVSAAIGRLRAEPDLAWRRLAAALLADELAGDSIE